MNGPGAVPRLRRSDPLYRQKRLAEKTASRFSVIPLFYDSAGPTMVPSSSSEARPAAIRSSRKPIKVTAPPA